MKDREVVVLRTVKKENKNHLYVSSENLSRKMSELSCTVTIECWNVIKNLTISLINGNTICNSSLYFIFFL